jgi:radical SAM superfamily enzyme YgiQ (UPF0313 family)
MKQVLLAYPKIDHEKDYVYFWMPFSLLTIAKELDEGSDVEVVLFDGNQQGLDSWEELLTSCASDLLFIGFSIMTGGGQIGHALEMAEVARKHSPDVPLVYGGPHVNVLPEQTARHELVDMCLTGPGQNSVPRLVRALLGQERLWDVPGLVVSNSIGFRHGPENPPRTGVLGQYPWHLLDANAYIRRDPTIAPRTLNYVSSQGCAYKCRFCYEQMYQRKWSSQLAEPLLGDIERLVSTFDLSGIKFYDADWFINLKRAETICHGLQAMSRPIRWAASINPNDVLKAREHRPGLLRAVADSGCSRLLMGVESGNDRVLRDIVAKEVTRADILSVAEEIASFGILGSYTFIVGFPGETDEEVEDTYSLLDELRTLSPEPESRVHLFAPYPGTPLFDAAVEAGFEAPATLAEWSSFDYYESQTPWTSSATVARARANTHMRSLQGEGTA